MNLTSCECCGVVLNQDNLIPKEDEDMEDKPTTVDDGVTYYLVSCPVCNCFVLGPKVQESSK